MNIGINFLLWSTELNRSHFDIIRNIKAWGYDGVEIPLSPHYSKSFLRELKHYLGELELACTCSAFLPPEASPIDPDPGIRQKALDQIKVFVDMTALLESPVLMGPMHSPHKQFPGRGPTETEMAHCAEVLKQAGEHAAQADIELSIEFLNRFECYFLTHSLQAKALVERIHHPNVGMTYDTHHAHLEDARVYDTMMSVQDAINHIHLSESHRGTPGKGLIRWEETFRAISEMEYTGWLVIETFGMHNHDLIMGANIWRNCFESEEQCCVEGLAFVKEALGWNW